MPIRQFSCRLCNGTFTRNHVQGRIPTVCPSCATSPPPKKCKRCSESLPTQRQSVCSRCAKERWKRKKRVQREPTQSPKVCKGCGQLKPAVKFLVSKNMADGRASKCNACRYAERKVYRQANGLPDKHVGRTRDYQAERERTAALKGITHKTKAQREAEIAAARAQRQQQEEQQRAKEKAKRIAERPWLAPGLTVAEKWKLRYRNDPAFHTSERIRHSLRKRRKFKNLETTLRRIASGESKSRTISKLLGYTGLDLHTHLQRQFTKGMTWERFTAGDIHIDHIVPIASFNLDDPHDIKAAYALSNLRPMWAKDNRTKWMHRETLL